MIVLWSSGLEKWSEGGSTRVLVGFVADFGVYGRFWRWIDK